MMKIALLGAWHSHAIMHVSEVASRPDEFELVGMYDADDLVIAKNKERWAEYGLDIPFFSSVEEVLDSAAEAVVVEGHVYQNLDYAERALEAGKHVLLEKPAGVDLTQLARVYLTEGNAEYEAGEWHDVQIETAAEFPSLLRELAACMRGEKEPDFSLAHDMAVQRTLFKGCGIEDGRALR